MSQVLVRNLDARIVASLKRKAEGAGLSLEAYLREALAREAEPSQGDLVAEIEALRQTVRPPARNEPLAADFVREGREARARQRDVRRGRRK